MLSLCWLLDLKQSWKMLVGPRYSTRVVPKFRGTKFGQNFAKFIKYFAEFRKIFFRDIFAYYVKHTEFCESFKKFRPNFTFVTTLSIASRQKPCKRHTLHNALLGNYICACSPLPVLKLNLQIIGSS
jgi:hypothetical protein